VSPAERVGGNDCDQRFTSNRRQAFQADVSFFHELPRRPHEPSWFTDNGYDQTPFFTAVTAPIFEIVPLSYGLLLGYASFDIALEILAVVVLYFAFGPRACALVASYFFTSFSNPFAAMGGAIGLLALSTVVDFWVARTARCRTPAVWLPHGSCSGSHGNHPALLRYW